MAGISFRHIYRLASREPGFILTVTLILGLGIGSCTAIFSLVKSVLFTSLPYRAAERMAIIWHTEKNPDEVTGVWARDYQTYRDTMRSFETVAAFTTQGYNLSNGSDPSRITCARVTSNLLPMLAITPLRGRWFTGDEDREGVPGTIILSYHLWRSHFGADEAVLGKTIHLDLKPHTVVGIMPASFVFPPQGVRSVSNAECWVPASFSRAEMATPAFNWIVAGQLKRGVGIAQAQQEASGVAQRILESYPAAVQKEVALRARVISLQDEVSGRKKTPLLVFAGSVGFLLLIGCANVANLMLARLHIRRREMAIRAALGATRASLTAQLLIESLMLAGLGGLLGIPIAFGMLRLLLIFTPGTIPTLDRVHIDTFTLLFTVVCSAASGVAFGLVPAIRARDVNIAVTIAEGNRGASAGRRQHRLRGALAVTEIAIAFVLLIGSGLLLRSFAKLSSVPPGFDPNHVLTFSIALPEDSYKNPIQVKQFVNAVVERLRGFPDVTFASAGTSLPIGASEATVFSRIGAPPAVAGFKAASIQTISPEYLQTLRIHVRRGRPIDAGDDASRMPVALVNEAMSQKYWPDTEVIGKQLYWLVGGRPLTVVGVVADVRQDGLSSAPMPTFYVPLAQTPQAIRNLVFNVRTTRSAASLRGEIRRVVAEVDPALPVFSLQSASDVVRNSIANEHFNMFVVTVFALCALALSILGLYAVISYLVVHSSTELAIRMALGAAPRRIVGMVMARGFKFLVIGMLIGASGALLLTRFMKSMLFGITETDAGTFLGVVALLASVAMLAILGPAIRATRARSIFR